MGLLPAARHVRRARQFGSVEPLESRRLLSSGGLDPTFGAGGKVTTDFPGSANDRGYDLVVQPDGKYVVAGSTTSSAGYSEDAGFAFARYNADGSLDPTFGDGGKVIVPFGRYGTAAAVALAPGGKIVAVGTTTGLNGTPGGGQNFAVVRLNPDGTLDTTFDGDGRQTIDFDGRSDSATDVVVLGDGRIVVLGRAEGPGSRGARDNALARLRPDGSLDPSFDGDGRLFLTVPGASFAAGAITLDGAGRLLVAGGASRTVAGQTSGGFGVVRLVDDGAVDPAFGTAGLGLATSGGNAQSVMIDPAGRILLTGSVATGGVLGAEAAVARLLPDGSVDTSFGGGDGFATVGLGPRNDYGADAAVDAAGNILVAGRTDPPDVGVGYVGVFRLDASGTPDASFDGDGAWMDNVSWSEARAVAAGPGGSVVIAGETRPNSEDYEFLLARLDAAGRPDAAFGAGGEVLTDFVGYTRNEANATVVQPDGKVIVGGTTYLSDNDYWTFSLVRYNADGSLDLTFGARGRVAGVPGLRRSSLYALALQPDGRIVAAGQGWDAAADNGAGKSVFAVARFTSDGTPDPSFGQGGKVLLAFDPAYGGAESARAVAIQDDGEIVVAGSTGGSTFAVARLTPSGVLDATFGAGGKAVVAMRDPGPWGGFAYVTGMALGPGGTITVAGPTGSDVLVSSTFGVARFDSSGRLHATFAGDGKTEIDVPGSYDDVKLVVTPDGGIVIGTTTMAYGPATGWSDRDFALLRLLPDGSRDTYFGGYHPGPDGTNADGGLVSIDFRGGDDVLHALLLLPDGTIVAAGSTDLEAAGGGFPFDYDRPQSDFGLVQINADGTSHNQLGTGGKVTTDFGGYEDEARGLALGPGGKLIAAGTAVVPGSATDFAVARYSIDLPPPDGSWLRHALPFYNNDGGFATDKHPLRPGQTPTFSNVTNDVAGITGVNVELWYAEGVSFGWSARVADATAPGGWREAPPADVTTWSDGGASGIYVQNFVWPDGAIRDTWLEVTVDVYVDNAADAGGVPVERVVFAFGNLVGETGDDGRVNALDLGQVKRLLNRPAAWNSNVDFNRDGRVNALDLGIVKRNLNRALIPPALALPPSQLPAATTAAAGVAATLLRENEPDAASPLP
jgi:uncharacterized delta-60 repeat protein